MGKAKKIGMGVGIAFAVLISIGILGSIVSDDNPSTETQNPSSSDSVSNPVSNTPQQHSSFSTNESTKSVLDMLPTRDDIGTEWRISPIAYNNNDLVKGYSGNSDVPIVSSTNIEGYEDGVTQDFTSEAVLKVAIATFDSKESAENYHNAITTKLYNEGGFQQLETRGIDAECFSVYKELGLSTTISEFYCVKENVYYTVKEYAGVSTFSDEVKETTIKFSQIIANKITERITSSQTLGALSFIEFTEKICSSDEGCTTDLVLANHDISACSILTVKNGCVSTYVSKFNEPEKCQEATNESDCLKTVSLTLGSTICNLIESESNRMECVKYYINLAPQKDNYSTNEIREVCSPTFKHWNFLVQQNACKIEQVNLDDISKSDLLTWETEDKLTICTRFDLSSVGEKRNDYCLSSIGVYLKDLSVCDQAGDARAECYGFVAVTDNSVNLDTCDRLEGTGITFCYMHVAYRLDDISICDIADTNKENCVRLVNSRNV